MACVSRGAQEGEGRPREPLFQVVGEKIPYQSLDEVRRDLRERGLLAKGVYVAHDSMGYARYIGRGDIFLRLKARKKAQEYELSYFSFYVVLNETQGREIESLLIRAAGPLLEFNDRKRRDNIQAGEPDGVSLARWRDGEPTYNSRVSSGGRSWRLASRSEAPAY